MTGPDGRYEIEAPTTGAYLVTVAREGFSEAVASVVIESADQSVEVPLTLEVGSLAAAVVVTANRAERDVKQIPLHVDTISRAAVEQTNQTSTGDALLMAANITPVGNGPFGSGRACAVSTRPGCWCWWTASASTPRARPPTAPAPKSA
jgi:outer membrane receptor protein involved in Fe transport